VVFPSDTLAEDQDLDAAYSAFGYKIGYEETAVAWTEAPHNLRSLAKQRFRWSYGTLQCMLETQRCAVSAALRRAGLHRNAQCLDLSDPVFR
jgi:cellulose synthase/poly-beta-1,6-N-acetylglucosamine synthase-like glycosyltransferase